MKTTLYTVLCIAIRLGAVLMAVGLLGSIPFFLNGAQDPQLGKLALALTALGLAVAFVLWLKPGVLAWWAASGGKGEVFESHIEADQIQYVAFSVMGVWLVVSSLANVVPLAIQLVRLHLEARDYPGEQVPIGAWTGLIRASVTMAAGVILTLGSRGLVRWLHRLRGYPMQPKTGGDDEITPRG